MRKIYSIFSAVLITATIWAQSPQKMSYQAVIRNNSDQLMTNHAVGMQISILQGSPTGAAVYVETQTPTTNPNGLVTVEIGGGTPVTGTLAGIDWSTGIYYIKTETDPNGGTSYTITGSSQLLSVPYALYAKTVASYPETDPVFGVWNKSTGINISASQVSDFQSSVTNNAAVSANTAKNSYPTADATKVANLSGTNTGDETSATIKSKLGITTLSGSNTGDQTLPTLTSLGGVASNTAITGATNTKITYDAKGLVTAGTAATTDDIAASTDKNYVTNAQLTVIGNTSGINTGDNAVNTQYSGLVTNAAHTGDVTGSGVLTIANKVTMTGTAPVSITGSPSVIATGAVDISIAAATTSTSGSMSAADKTKLDGIPTSSYYLGQEKDGGIIFYIYKGSDGLEHGLIVSKTETTASWGGSTVIGADRTEDGAYNMNLMSTDEGTARAWIEALGAGWYLPSIDELCLLWHSRYHVNKTARAISSTLLSTAAPYWSSTEYNDNSSFFFYFFWGYQANAAKSDASFSVRAVRAF